MNKLPIRIRTILWSLGVAIVICQVASAQQESRLARDQAVETAIRRWVDTLPADLPIANIGVVPVVSMERKGKDPIMTEYLQSILSSRARVVIMQGPEWDRLIEEIARTDPGEGFGDIMNPETIQQFGRMEGVDALLFGKILEDLNESGVYSRVRLILSLAEVETGAILHSAPVSAEVTAPWYEAIRIHPRIAMMIIAGLIGLYILIVLFKKAGGRPR
ncbi:MAG: hypothetical protein PHC78_09055 [Verrucomicrobiota bacterium]|nr:hypothetical protein [Verrucomicrobiota bacterium]